MMNSESGELLLCPNREYSCTFLADTQHALEKHLETDCQKELLRKYIAEKESALNQLKNEVRIREEELINLKLVLLGDVERDKPQHQIEEEQMLAQLATQTPAKQPDPAVKFFKALGAKISSLGPKHQSATAATSSAPQLPAVDDDANASAPDGLPAFHTEPELSSGPPGSEADDGVPTLLVQSESGTELGRVITNGDEPGRDVPNDAPDSPAASGFSSIARKLGFFGYHSRSSSRDISHDSVVSANSNQHDDRASYTSGKSGTGRTTPGRDGPQVSYVLPPMLSEFNIDDEDDEDTLDLQMDMGMMDSVPLYGGNPKPDPKPALPDRRSSRPSLCDDALEEVLNVSAGASVAVLRNLSENVNGAIYSPTAKGVCVDDGCKAVDAMSDTRNIRDDEGSARHRQQATKVGKAPAAEQFSDSESEDIDSGFHAFNLENGKVN